MNNEIKLKVNILPDEKEVICNKGTTILNTCASAGIMLNAPCSGEGTCGKCVVQVIEGASAPDSCEFQLLSGTMLKTGYRFACRSKVNDNMRLIIPSESRIVKEKKVKASTARVLSLRPNIVKMYLKLQQPKERAGVSHLEVLEKAILRRFGKIETPLELIRRLPNILKAANYKVTAVIMGRRLTDLEIGDTTRDIFGVSFDIGTNVIAGALININNGKEIGTVSDVSFLSKNDRDLKAKITTLLRNPEGGLKELQDALINRINGIITELISKKKIRREHIYEMSAAGSSVMQHILLGINPTSLASATHHPVIKRSIDADAATLGINLNRMARVYVMPSLSGFVGGDAISLILSAAMNKDENIKLAVGLGANGIIILGSKERMLIYSTSASSAFDGIHINNGMLPSEGAVEDIKFNLGHKHKKGKDIELKVIGNVEPEGITSGAVVALLSELKRLGVIEKNGRIRSKEELRNSLDSAILNRIGSDNNGNTFTIYNEKRKKIALTQRDVKEIQIAKGTIRAAIEIMKGILKITDDDIMEVYLSGTYGITYNPERIADIGVFPTSYLEKLEYLGDSTSIGAKMALLSKDIRAEAEIISNSVEYLDLASREDFQDEFSIRMNF
ncbi:MAG: DUF4445 domain-containing protein [Nitrospirae bacterium]|nr:DUF4445 domain-containing protein [Nitrospirota bacterium]